MDKWLSHPTAVKILSVVIGILLWAVVHFDPGSTPNTVATATETRSINAVKIQTVGLDESTYSLKLLEPSLAKIMVKGTRTALAFTSDSDYTVSVNLTGKGEGTYSIPLTVGKLPRGVDFVTLSPSQVQVVIDRLDTAPFDVGVVTQGKPAEGYELGAPVIKSARTIEVTLPAQDLARVGSVKVFVNVDGETGPVHEKKASISVFDKSGNEIKGAVFNPPTVDVEVPIALPMKEVPLQIGYKGELPEGLDLEGIQSGTATVTLYGSRAQLEGIHKLEADIDLSQIHSTGEVSLELLPPEGLKEVVPSKVTVTVTLAPADMRTFKVPVTFDHLDDGLEAAITDPEDGQAQVKISGTEEELDRLEASEIRAVADVQNLQAGTYKIELQLTLPNYVKAAGDPPTVSVALTARDTPASASPGVTPEPSPGAEQDAQNDGSGQKHGAVNESASDPAEGADQEAGDAPPKASGSPASSPMSSPASSPASDSDREKRNQMEP